jgi:hypothetical protein
MWALLYFSTRLFNINMAMQYMGVKGDRILLNLEVLTSQAHGFRIY